MCVNTDDPGISRTDLTNEFYKAAWMTGGLKKWEVLQLVRNSFRAVFAQFDMLRRLLLDAEKRVLEVVNPRAGDLAPSRLK